MALRLRFELQMYVRTCFSAAVFLWLFFMFSSLMAGAIAAESGFSGQFAGIGTAVGMTLSLEESEGRVVGRFSSGRGEPFSLNGRRTGEAAQGSVIRSGQKFFFHLEARPLGVQFLLIPKAPDGGPDIAGATDYSFVQQGVQVPQPSTYRTAPPRGINVDIIDFIDGFRDWSPTDMARVYASLDGRYKELIQLFDHAASEIVWRVCATNPPNDFFSKAELDRLLDRQGTSCREYLSSVADVRDAGLLNEFLRKANFQFELIRETVKCDRGQSSETKCADVSAMSAPLMVRWRRATDIMSELVGGRVMPQPQPQSEPLRNLADDIPSLVDERRDVAPVPIARPGMRSERQLSGVSSLEGEHERGAETQTDAVLDQAGQVPLPRARPGVRLRPET